MVNNHLFNIIAAELLCEAKILVGQKFHPQIIISI